jgi:hypothetical protein
MLIGVRERRAWPILAVAAALPSPLDDRLARARRTD